MGWGIDGEDGKAAFAYGMKGHKDYLKGFADLYAKGLIDPEIISGNRTFS